MSLYMTVNFQIKRKVNEDFISLSKGNVSFVTIGGYTFTCGDKTFPFDWDGHSGGFEDDVLCFDTGYGLLNEFELTDCFDEEYAEMGITREDLTAEFLASVTKINEFFVSFDLPECEDVGFGDNEDAVREGYHITLLNMSFTDYKTGNVYPVSKAVLEDFNRF